MDARDFIKTGMSAERILVVPVERTVGHFVPSMPKVLADNVSLNPAFTPIAEDVQKYGYSPPLFTGTFDALTQLTEALNPGWVGLSSTDDALADANSKLQAILDKK